MTLDFRRGSLLFDDFTFGLTLTGFSGDMVALFQIFSHHVAPFCCAD